MNDPGLVVQQFLQEGEHLRGYSRATLKTYRNIVSIYHDYAKLSSIQEATTETVRNFVIYGRRDCGWKPATTRGYVKVLRVYFEWCIKRGFLAENPALDIELPRKEKRVRRNLSDEESDRLLETVYNFPWPNDYLRYRNYAIFATYIFAGLRKTELLNLNFMDVDFTAMTIFVRQGKGSKDRMIPMDYTLAQILKRYVTERQKRAMTAPAFFVSSTKGGRMSVMALEHIVRQMRKASGIYFTLHQLRHTFATQLLRNGCNLKALQTLMGHANIETTLIYLEGIVDHLQPEIAKHPMSNRVAVPAVA